jgi:monoterpene epsilon-lactone hydrolase
VESQLAAVGALRAAAHPARINEHDLSGVTLYEVVPASASEADADKVIYHVHGGAFIVGGGLSAAYSAQSVASVAGLHSYSIDYRMPPDHPFPAGLDDALAGYRYLLSRYDPNRIAIEGSSAGANLAAAVILKARDSGLPMPGACILHTAAVDLTHSGDTFRTNEILDVVLRTADNNAMQLYCGGHDPHDPYLSPIFADFSTGFPPTLLIFRYQGHALVADRDDAPGAQARGPGG